jgi:hypothetical protein
MAYTFNPFTGNFDYFVAGTTGPQGPSGPAGANGVMGFIGADGQDGEEGLIGPPGAAGVAGAQGQTGAAGTPGVDGQDGEEGVSWMISPPVSQWPVYKYSTDAAETLYIPAGYGYISTNDFTNNGSVVNLGRMATL